MVQNASKKDGRGGEIRTHFLDFANLHQKRIKTVQILGEIAILAPFAKVEFANQNEAIVLGLVRKSWLLRDHSGHGPTLLKFPAGRNRYNWRLSHPRIFPQPAANSDVWRPRNDDVTNWRSFLRRSTILLGQSKFLQSTPDCVDVSDQYHTRGGAPSGQPSVRTHFRVS